MSSCRTYGGGIGVDGIATQTGAAAVLDPVVSWTLRIFLSALFARALAGKLVDPSGFAAALRGYELLPGALVGVVASALLGVEVLLVPALLVPVTAAAASLAAATLLLVYAAAIGINLARGRRDIDCGCAGPGTRQTLHEMLIPRNVVYASMAAAAALPAAVRSLAWLDGFTVGIGVAVLFSLAIAVDGLAALAPALSRIRGRS